VWYLAPKNGKNVVACGRASAAVSVEHPFGGLATGKPCGSTAHDFASQPCDWFAFIEDAEDQQAKQFCTPLPGRRVG
jgi:hypothetical protein